MSSPRGVQVRGQLITRYDEFIQAKAAHLAEQQAKRRTRARATAQELVTVFPSKSSKVSQTVTQWTSNSITFTVRRVTGEDLAITRREAIAAGASTALVGAALTDPLQQWLHPIGDDVEFATRGPDFCADELASLEGLVGQFRGWVRSGHGMLVRKAVVAQLNDVTDRLHEGSPEPANWRAFGVAAELAEVVASISWDHGLHRSAQRYYVLSVQLAKLAHDDVHAATVLAALTRQCYDLGRPREGLEIVELAQYGSRKTATALLRSMLATREAWGYALLGESQAFTRAVGLAEEYFSEGASDSDHRRVRNFDAAELTGVIGGRYRELARREPRWARKAQDHIEKALELRHPSEHRLHTFDLIGLARTQLISADPERACEVVHQAISLGRPWVNGRVGAKLRDFHQEASRYAEIPVVRDTRDLIRELTSANGWMRGYALPRIGITGHMDLSRDSVSLVAGALRDVLRGRSEGELVGISCLARGSDQIFARVVLECGGFLEIVLPAADYRERKVVPDNLVEFDDFISRARVVRTLPCEESNRDAYMAASEEVLGSIDSLVAVWDGNPAGGYSGTADVVAAARERGIPVTVVWPDGARRT